MSANKKLSPSRLYCLWLSLSLAIVLLWTPISSRADTLEDAARALAEKISAMVAPREKLSLSVHNLSALLPEQVLYFQKVVESELSGRGHVVLHGQSNEASLKISLSQNLTSFLSVVELVQAGKTYSLIEPLNIATPQPFVGNPSKQFTLSSELVWKQRSPILDLKFLIQAEGQPERFAVLGPETLSVQQRKETGWALVKTFSLRGASVQSRDPRGELFQFKEGSGFRLITGTSGATCSVILDTTLDLGNLDCDSSQKNELTGATLLTFGPHVIDNGAKWDAFHNYFSGEMFGESGTMWKVEPFYASTFYSPKPEDVQEVWIAAGIDGHIHVISHDHKDLRIFAGSGSELTAVHNECDDGWYVLMTGTGDWTAGDRITAFQLEGSSFHGFDQFVELPGPVLSLGSEQIPTFGEIKESRASAIAVIRNLKSGDYEAYRISIACAR